MAPQSWALTVGHMNPIEGRESATRAMRATSSLRDGRSRPVSGSIAATPQPSVVK